MQLTNQELWCRFQKYYSEYPSIGLALDISRMNFNDDFLKSMALKVQNASQEMAQLERGAIANADEKRMVGHYWLRNPALAPSSELRAEIEKTVEDVKAFASDVHSGRIKGTRGKLKNILVIGIGGSALGPQFVANALGHPSKDKMTVYFLDNTDPDGIERVLASISHELGQTLSIVISKSGGTKETRNGMLETKAGYERAGVKFEPHAVAVTGEGSNLDQVAKAQGWLKTFPMWDWVGGRTSELSAVGLLPAALQGIQIQAMLDGAKACDEVTRQSEVSANPAMQLALMWYYIGQGKGLKDMVVLPYKDRLELFSRYLQQLVMESLGKELDQSGKLVNQGIAVYGNKGSTDQHAYVQQLRDGLNNFFVTFIEVRKDADTSPLEVEPGITSGDYLNGFLQGTRQALYEKDRESISISLQDVSPFSVGVLIALFERAVGFYASLININAYHQPGVEAGKKAAGGVIELQLKVLNQLRSKKGEGLTVTQIARETGGDPETIFKICEHLTANPGRAVKGDGSSGPAERAYKMI